MGLTSATGDPVLCICILDTQSLSVTDFKGLDYCTSIPYDPSKTMEENMGDRKTLIGFPVWKFRGKSIPYLMCMSPKVSISSDILTEALNYLDQLNVLKRRQYGPAPIGLLDFHGSRPHLPLLEYINSKTSDGLRKWIQTIITPNDTNVWKVGDIRNNNRCWNMATTLEKDPLIQFKQRH